MKVGRNDPCPCGSGKKHKHCCMDAIAKRRGDLIDGLSQTVAMNPTLTIDELNIIAEQKMAEQNNRPDKEFCGLSPAQMYNWLYAPFGELDQVNFRTPEGLSASPVMSYLSLIIDEAMEQGGSFKATAKGNLPAKLVRQASELLPQFAVAQFETMLSISEFSGSNEDKFNALHYARILAELAGIIYRKGGRFHVKKAAQKQYQSSGIAAFFLPMLEAAVEHYNWGYFDNWPDDIRLDTFWLFMLWRLSSHGSVAQLIKEVEIAFPDLLQEIPEDGSFSKLDTLTILIESRFVKRFLQFWGFVIVDPRRYIDDKRVAPLVTVLPLLKNSVSFLA